MNTTFFKCLAGSLIVVALFAFVPWGVVIATLATGAGALFTAIAGALAWIGVKPFLFVFAVGFLTGLCYNIKTGSIRAFTAAIVFFSLFVITAVSVASHRAGSNSVAIMRNENLSVVPGEIVAILYANPLLHFGDALLWAGRHHSAPMTLVDEKTRVWKVQGTQFGEKACIEARRTLVPLPGYHLVAVNDAPLSDPKSSCREGGDNTVTYQTDPNYFNH
jgi:hypothetical protein